MSIHFYIPEFGTMNRVFISGLVVMASVVAAIPSSANPTVIQWGSNETITSRDVDLDAAGNAYVVGLIGSLAAQQDTHDLFLRRYNTNGTLAWARQLGNTAIDFANGVAVDGAGNAYLTGYSQDGLGVGGLPQAGRTDAFLARYNANGTLAWTRQMGSSGLDRSNDVAVDGTGNVYITGITENGLDGGSPGAFLRRFSSGGTVVWTRDLGIGLGSSLALAADSAGNVYVAGYTQASLAGPSAGIDDAFLMRYGADGTRAWTRQLGTNMRDRAEAVAVDQAGSVYIGGTTEGTLSGMHTGSTDAFVARYTDDGTLLWTRQLGTVALDSVGGLAVNGGGDIYLSGSTQGSLDGANKGSQDTFLARYNAEGALLWTHQLGSAQSDSSSGAAVDSVGSVFICGTTSGDLGGGTSGFGFSEAFLAKYTSPFPTGDFEMRLEISRNGGNFDFEWNTRSGRFYDLVSHTDLSSPPSEWTVWRGLEGIPASGTTTHTLTAIPGGTDIRRFFAVVERDLPP